MKETLTTHRKQLTIMTLIFTIFLIVMSLPDTSEARSANPDSFAGDYGAPIGLAGDYGTSIGDLHLHTPGNR